MNASNRRRKIIGKELNDLWKIKGSLLCPLGNPAKRMDNNPVKPTEFDRSSTISQKDT